MQRSGVYSIIFYATISLVCLFIGVSCQTKPADEHVAPVLAHDQGPASDTDVAAPIVSDLPEAVNGPVAVNPQQSTSRDPDPIANTPNPAPANPDSTDPQLLAPPVEKQPIKVSQEVFDQTFNEVEKLIKTLNSIILSRDYKAWTKYLSDDYLAQMSRSDVLKQYSQSPTLQKNNVILKTLADYFAYVVVPSRANVRLDDLVFLSENEVMAIMKVGDRRVTVYRLIKIDGQWKIGLS